MTHILAHPFRITPGETVATVEADTDAAYAQHLAVLISTSLGERTLVPAFGLPDPAFRGLRREELQARVELWGPPVSIVGVASEPIAGGQQQVEVTFE